MKISKRYQGKQLVTLTFSNSEVIKALEETHRIHRSVTPILSTDHHGNITLAYVYQLPE